MSVEPQRRGLGRGLSALLGEAEREQPVSGNAGERSLGLQTISVAAIQPNPLQPRRHFDEAALVELAASIAERGVMQPIVVRPFGANGFQIVAGERRWRAAQRARLHEVPAIVRELTDAQTFELAIIENVQREDLNAIEEAEAYQRLARDFGHTQEMLGRLVNKSRSHVANLLRLLDLPEAVRTLLAAGKLSMGHARALITAPDPAALAEEVVRRDLSVRETEKLAKDAKPQARSGSRPRVGAASAENADVESLQRHLGDILGLKVQIDHGDKGGKVSISYSTLDQLDLVCQRLSGEPI